MVRAPVGNLARAVIRHPPPSSKCLAWVVVARLGGALPHLPVETFGNGHGFEDFRLEIRRQPYLYASDAPEIAVADNLRRAHEVRKRPLPRARLPYAAGVQHGVAQNFALAYGAREGLFAEHVLAGVDARYSHYGVPVVGKRRHHDVDVGVGEHVAEIRVHGNVHSEELARVAQAFGVLVVVPIVLPALGVVDVAEPD